MREIVLQFLQTHTWTGLRPADAHHWRPLDCGPDDRAFYTHRTFPHWGEIHNGFAITDGEVVLAVTFDGRHVECKFDNLERHLMPQKRLKRKAASASPVAQFDLNDLL